MTRLAELTGLSRGRIYQYTSEDAKFRFKINEIDEIIIVDTEGKVYRNTEGDDYWRVINFPDNIRPIHTWTVEEVKNAEAIKQLCPGATEVVRTLSPDISTHCTKIYYANRHTTGHTTVWNDYFPSLKCGEKVPIGEIIERCSVG